MADTAFARLETADVAEVAELETLCFSTPWSEAQLAAALALPHFIAYGVRRQGRLLAYITLAHTPGELEILNIATSPDCRRQGHARQLLTMIIGTMPQLDVERMVLEVRVSNIPARALYKSLGFIRAGLRKAYYKDTGEDALIMSLDGNMPST